MDRTPSLINSYDVRCCRVILDACNRNVLGLQIVITSAQVLRNYWVKPLRKAVLALHVTMQFLELTWSIFTRLYFGQRSSVKAEVPLYVRRKWNVTFNFRQLQSFEKGSDNCKAFSLYKSKLLHLLQCLSGLFYNNYIVISLIQLEIDFHFIVFTISLAEVVKLYLSLISLSVSQSSS